MFDSVAGISSASLYGVDFLQAVLVVGAGHLDLDFGVPDLKGVGEEVWMRLVFPVALCLCFGVVTGQND